MPVKKSSKSKKSTAKSQSNDGILYPEIEVAICQGDEAITAEKAQELLGWRIVPDDSDEEYLFKDLLGNKITCDRNLHNRQLYPASVSTISQELLRGRWRMNGEPIIVGKKGTLLNGQHSLIGLVMATQFYEDDPDRYPFWYDRSRTPVMDKIVTFGVDEDDDVVNTMDTCKPRSLTDVIFRSDFFEGTAAKEKKELSRVLDYAVRLLWFRTGVGADAYAPRRTHSEAIDFINRHERILHCVKFMYDANENNNVAKLVSLGTAAGLMYLMACSQSDPTEYLSSENPSENFLSFDLWDQAEEFWTKIGMGSTEMNPVRRSMAAIIEENNTISPVDRLAVIVKAWNVYSEGGVIKDKDVKLKYKEQDDGFRVLMELPTIGGIDVGSPSNKEPDISPEEIARERNRIQKEKDAAMKDEAKAAKKTAKKAGKKAPKAKPSSEGIDPKSFKEGETLTVTDPANNEKWTGTYVDHYPHNNRGIVVKVKIDEGFAGAGKIYDIDITNVSR